MGESLESREQKEYEPVGVAVELLADPRHPEHTQDQVIGVEILGGDSGIIAAIDGVGSGKRDSAYAAGIVRRSLKILSEDITEIPSVEEGKEILSKSLLGCAPKIRNLQMERDNEDADTVAAIGMVCESEGKRFLVIANVGDARIYEFDVAHGLVKQLSHDHSYVDLLVKNGLIKPEEAFSYPGSNIVTKTVGTLETVEDINFDVIEIKEDQIYIAMSDGISDNFPPAEMPTVLLSEFKAAFDPTIKKVDLVKFVRAVAAKARAVQQSSASYAKMDDISIAALRIPRKR